MDRIETELAVAHLIAADSKLFEENEEFILNRKEANLFTNMPPLALNSRPKVMYHCHHHHHHHHPYISLLGCPYCNFRTINLELLNQHLLLHNVHVGNGKTNQHRSYLVDNGNGRVVNGSANILIPPRKRYKLDPVNNNNHTNYTSTIQRLSTKTTPPNQSTSKATTTSAPLDNGCLTAPTAAKAIAPNKLEQQHTESLSTSSSQQSASDLSFQAYLQKYSLSNRFHTCDNCGSSFRSFSTLNIHQFKCLNNTQLDEFEEIPLKIVNNATSVTFPIFRKLFQGGY